jgi:hypothetical protein
MTTGTTATSVERDTKQNNNRHSDTDKNNGNQTNRVPSQQQRVNHSRSNIGETDLQVLGVLHGEEVLLIDFRPVMTVNVGMGMKP